MCTRTCAHCVCSVGEHFVMSYVSHRHAKFPPHAKIWRSDTFSCALWITISSTRLAKHYTNLAPRHSLTYVFCIWRLQMVSSTTRIYVYAYIYTHVYMYICICTCVYTYIPVYKYAHTHAQHASQQVPVLMSPSVICICMYTYIYVYIHMCILTFMYINTPTHTHSMHHSRCPC